MTVQDTSAAPRRPVPTAHEERAATLYNAPAKTSRELYPLETTIKTDLDANLARLEDRLGLSPEDQTIERRAFLATMQATALDEDVATAVLLHTVWTEARLAGARPGGDDLDVQAQRAAMGEQTWNELCLKYGADAHPLVERTQKFVTQHPLLAEILGTRTVG